MSIPTYSRLPTSSDITSQMNNWVVEVKKKLSHVKSTPKTEAEHLSISSTESFDGLDEGIREIFSEPDYCIPRIVSFGPCYFGSSASFPTDRMKELVFLRFLKKSNKNLDDYILVLKNNVEYLKEKYDALDPVLKEEDASFLRLMIIDGCFLLEVLHELCNWSEAEHLHKEYKSDNPIWHIDSEHSTIELREHYIHDVLLPKNQIPILVLYRLCGVQLNDFLKGAKQVHYYIQMLPPLFPWNVREVGFATDFVLDLYRDRICFGRYTQPVRVESDHSSASVKAESDIDFLYSILSAKLLKEVRIEFTTSKNMALTDVSFTGGILKLPKVFVDPLTRTILFNMIVHEYINEDVGKEVSSYVYFMSKLLRDADDIKLLASRGIMRSKLNHDEIIEVFDSLVNEDIMRDPDIFLNSHYMLVVMNLRKHYDKMSQEWRRDLWQNYLRSPFAIVSVIAALLLFLLSVVQTVYTILGYYNLN